jgi:DNA-binding MarR family transcriptional regulator
MDATNVANVLGALAFRLADEIDGGLADLEVDGKAVAALVHLSKYPNESIERLRVPVGLSHSGCVRLVDRLAELGLVRRRATASDARAVEIALTRKGRALAARAHERRQEVLLRAVRSLAPTEQEQLGVLIGKVFASEVTTAASALRSCRLCDYAACKRCPLRGDDAASQGGSS